MKKGEFFDICLAVLILAVVIVPSVTKLDAQELSYSFLFAAAIILLAVIFRKWIASLLDADVEHKTWAFSRYGLRKHQTFKREIPAGRDR